jgi:hypothetical protein
MYLINKIFNKDIGQNYKIGIDGLAKPKLIKSDLIFSDGMIVYRDHIPLILVWMIFLDNQALMGM